MPDKLHFQDIISQLTDFWKEQGCLVWHPHNTQVGAGTMNPATVLRVLGPEPWNVVYFEPSIRPDDGRFGDNPNRMQLHHQLQVILKPDPGNPQELFLDSLDSIGIKLAEHDIRFVEDNWEQPALGAWGLGWEVWLDGQEITQFTYFQQAGGINLDPVSVEITYGLDRIALALQGVDSVWDINFGAGMRYGDLLLQSEIEHCHYYFNVADVKALKEIYDAYENEAKRSIEVGLVAPAHDFNLKCSFLFNVLDTRGAIGVTERAQYFRRMRRIAGQVSELYLEQRLRLEYPFLENENWTKPVAEKSQEPPASVPPAQKQVAVSNGDSPQAFVLEIGSEELPAGDLESAARQLKSAAPEMLERLRLSYEYLEVRGTPRRLALIIHNLSSRQDDLEIEVKGPPAERAFDTAGEPTKAAIGFARSKGVRTSDLRVVTEGNRQYVAATVREDGLETTTILSEELPVLIASIKFERSMRWNQSNTNYSRPLRWLVALYGRHVIPLSYAGLQGNRISRGLRVEGAPEIEIGSASEYADKMAEHGIIVQTSQRKAVIWTAAVNLAEDAGGMVLEDPELLAEVTNLVEQPTLLIGRYEERFLDLPVEVLVAVMKKHQRYFPVYSKNGSTLLPYFITARNGGNQYLDNIRAGNEHVIHARFADAVFFYKKDSKQDLTTFLSKLDTLTFQADIGSMLDKVKRLEKLSPLLAEKLEMDENEKADASRAAALSKADLASSLVVEMTSLQGIMGGHYARRSGESEAVALAIAEQYEAVSQTKPGLVLALADRLDSLIGLFAVGLAPKGSNDPFALRRAAIQIIENLIANQVEIDLRQALADAAGLLPIEATSETLGEVMFFIHGRLETYLQEQGIRTSVVRAVLAEQGHNPYSAAIAARALYEIVMSESWSTLLDAYARCVRITREQPAFELDPSQLNLPEEKALWKAFLQASKKLDGTVSSLTSALTSMEPSVSGFFNEVLVMDDDQEIRRNRLALVQKIAGITNGIADLSYLEGF